MSTFWKKNKKKLSSRTRGAALVFYAGIPHIWGEEHGQKCNKVVAPLHLQCWFTDASSAFATWRAVVILIALKEEYNERNSL